MSLFLSMKNFEFLLILFVLNACVEKKSSFERIESFKSTYIADRTIQIYLPPTYYSGDKKYPVLYMHDGQMLFDSTTTWNGQEWGVDETMDQLISDESVKEAIIVGIWNGGTELRHSEYFPQKPFESMDSTVIDSLYELERSPGFPLFGSKVQSDEYLKFLTRELKPFIDSTYSTLEDKSNTFIMGSSMGGLISMYAICEYPEIFGGAACLSTHWPGTFTVEENPIPDAFFDYLKNSIPNPEDHLLYFDYGTETLDALYETLQPIADSIIIQAGYSKSNFLTKKFEGAPHDEKAWKNRLHIPLTFLLSNK